MTTKTGKPLVSVIIPSFNAEQYIAETIQSILNQSHPEIEIIVVDDGSSDRTMEIVRRFGSRVCLTEQANSGVCVARNKGFAQSSGDFVCFMDHDDYWYPWKIERQIDTFSRHPRAGLVFTDFALWNSTNGHFPSPATFDQPIEIEPREVPEFSGWVYHQFLLDCWALTSSTMIRREAFARSGGFDMSLPYSEDWDLWLRLARDWQFIKLAEVSTLYRQHPSQGNRKPRSIDYRTRLLWSAREKWGLSSPDGRSITERQFNQNIAQFHFEYGRHQLLGGNRRLAIRSMSQAVVLHPQKVDYLLRLAAATVGWTPGQR